MKKTVKWDQRREEPGGFSETTVDTVVRRSTHQRGETRIRVRGNDRVGSKATADAGS